jgi:hypothetical protein
MNHHVWATESVEARILLGCQHLLLVLLSCPTVTASPPPCTRRASLRRWLRPEPPQTGLFPQVPIRDELP